MAGMMLKACGTRCMSCMHALMLTFWGCPSTQVMRLDQKDAQVRVPAAQPYDAADCKVVGAWNVI